MIGKWLAVRVRPVRGVGWWVETASELDWQSIGLLSRGVQVRLLPGLWDFARMAERLKAADCKSAGVCPRRFESCSELWGGEEHGWKGMEMDGGVWDLPE